MSPKKKEVRTYFIGSDLERRIKEIINHPKNNINCNDQKNKKKSGSVNNDKKIFSTKSYDRSKERILIEPNVLRGILDEIKNRDPDNFPSDNKISDYIGTKVSSALRGYAMNKKSFENLQKIYRAPIPHEIKEPWQIKVSLNKSENLVEMIGIMLGDGHLNKADGRIEVALNGVDDWEYVEYVNEIMKDLFQKPSRLDWLRDRKSAKGNEKGVVLLISSVELVEKLESLGLIPGNKCKNQVGVPEWIKNYKKFIIRCLKGLVDTDGWIGVVKQDKSIGIKFSSCSQPLVDDFILMCNLLGIRTSNLLGPYRAIDRRSGNVSEQYLVKISAKDQVKKFINAIKPEKWKLRFNYIGTILISLSNDSKRKKIEYEVKKAFLDIQIQYSKEYEEFLVNSCKKYGYLIDNNTIEQVINSAFEYKKTYYNKDYAAYLKKLFEELGSSPNITDFLIQEGVSPIPTKKTIRSYIQKLFEEQDYKIKYATNIYEKWLMHNYPIFIKNKRVKKFSEEAKKILCKWIYLILIEEGFIINNSEVIQKLKFLINNIDFNEVVDELKSEEIIIDDEMDDSYKDVRILKFDRLSFLLNNQRFSDSINDYLKILIKFIREVISLSNSNFNMSLDDIRRHIRNKLNINWKNEPLREILQLLPDKLFSFL